MLRQIRRGVFETNSSSVHSLTIASKEEFDKFKAGELRKVWRGGLVDSSSNDFEDGESFEDFGGDEYEYFEQTYTTEGGETIVAFGYYGTDN